MKSKVKGLEILLYMSRTYMSQTHDQLSFIYYRNRTQRRLVSANRNE